MNLINAVLLGIIQGLTEFIPVSSSGHLVLFQKIFGITEPLASPVSLLLFDTMVHTGTLIAVCAVLWKDIWPLLKKLNQPLTLWLIIATVPTVAAALLFRKPLEKIFETGNFLGFAFLATSALLITAELIAARKPSSDSPPKKMNWFDALVVGLMQAIAVIPGVSRSGATISGALSRMLDRDFAARFSFLLSIPAILGALLFQLKDLLKGSPVPAESNSIGAAAIIAGTLSAAIVGFLAVKFMLMIIRKRKLWGFAVYTGLLGILVLIDQFASHLVF